MADDICCSTLLQSSWPRAVCIACIIMVMALGTIKEKGDSAAKAPPSQPVKLMISIPILLAVSAADTMFLELPLVE